MMRNSIPKPPHFFQVCIKLSSNAHNIPRSIEGRKYTHQVSVPQTAVMAAGEHLLPKDKLQLWYCFARRGLNRGSSLQISTRTVAVRRIRQADRKRFVPWPSWTVDRFKRVRDGISYDHLANMEGSQERGRQSRVPRIQSECSRVVRRVRARRDFISAES